MRVGEKVYCKKNWTMDKTLIYTAGCVYEIIFSNTIEGIVEISSNVKNETFLFSMGKITNIDYFKEYFLSTKEYRKIKLNKLNKC